MSKSINASLMELLGSFDPTLPLDRAKSIPSGWYTRKDFLRLENEALFLNTWQFVGHESRFQEVGSFLQVRIGGERIIVLRNEAGELNAFYDVCRHKAASVLSEPCGVATRLRCRYHGWTYDLSGKLIGTPDFKEVQDFSKETMGLPSVNLQVESGLVFIHLGHPKVSLADFIQPLLGQVPDMKLDQFLFYDRRTYELECNWKVFVDNYLDGGYHINTVHPSLAGVLDYSGYQTSCEGFTSLQSSPMKKTDSSIDSVRKGEKAYYWWVYPNLMFNVYEGVMDSNWVVPLGVDRCLVVFDYYFTQSQWENASESIRVAHDVQLEDEGVCREVQLGLQSRSYDTGRFSVKREPAAYYFHQTLHREISQYLQ